MGKSTISMERSTILYGIYPTKKKTGDDFV